MPRSNPRYDVLLLDLDGVVYIGAEPVPHAVPSLSRARDAGVALCCLTNNASRTPEAVAVHLTDLGLPMTAAEVYTSAQGAARMLAQRLPPGASVFVIGGEGLEVALRAEGLRPTGEPEAAAAVVSGYHPDLRWKTVIEGAMLVAQGLPWVASNRDLTVPTPRGQGPGNGVLVNAVAEFADRQPDVAGKPEPTLFLQAADRLQARRPLVVGDRVDTDIEGAVAAGFDSLLVLTGVTAVEDLGQIPAAFRPTWVAGDLRGLPDGERWEATEALTAVCRELWAAVDAGDQAVGLRRQMATMLSAW